MAKDLLAETMVALTVSKLRSEEAVGLINTTSAVRSENVTSGFVETHEVKVCRGKYAKALSLAWHAWKTEQGSENEDVNKFSSKQLFTVSILLPLTLNINHFLIFIIASLLYRLS